MRLPAGGAAGPRPAARLLRAALLFVGLWEVQMQTLTNINKPTYIWQTGMAFHFPWIKSSLSPSFACKEWVEKLQINGLEAVGPLVSSMRRSMHSFMAGQDRDAAGSMEDPLRSTA
ncbi:hypothetical protein MHYP_G00344360 [Metynnis hypsauchen]